MSLERREDDLGKMGKDLPLFGLYSNTTNKTCAFLVLLSVDLYIDISFHLIPILILSVCVYYPQFTAEVTKSQRP